jgi:ribonuclease HI
MNSPALLTIYTDGASRGNPGAAAFAYTIEREGEDPIEEAGCLGNLTNNQAEYTALVRALRHALTLGPEHSVLVNSDSELMVKQMKGEYRVKNAELLPLYEEARDLVKRFQGKATLQHIRRALNSRADALCNEALDGKRKPTAPTPAKTANPVAAVKPTALRAEAVEYLREAVLAWAGESDGPSPEEIWDRLQQLIKRHGVALPA